MVTPELNGRPGVRPLTAPPGSGGPTVLRILLGAQLRRLREAKRITLEDAGQVIRASGSKMSRLETGRVGFKDRDISDLLTLYGVTDTEQRDAIRSLARDASAQGWWHDYSDILPTWFEAYVGLEEAASRIRACSATPTSRPTRSSAGLACGWPARTCSPGRTRRTCGSCWTRRCSAGPSAARA